MGRRRTLAFWERPEDGALGRRREELKQVLDALEEVWQARNRLSDWPATRRGIEAAWQS